MNGDITCRNMYGTHRIYLSQVHTRSRTSGPHQHKTAPIYGHSGSAWQRHVIARWELKAAPKVVMFDHLAAPVLTPQQQQEANGFRDGSMVQHLPQGQRWVRRQKFCGILVDRLGPGLIYYFLNQNWPSGNPSKIDRIFGIISRGQV